MEIKEIFSSEELKYISRKRPDLIPLRVPSINEYTLEEPSLDQIIVQFLKRYDVNLEPRTVGEWNGWDTLSLISRKENIGDISSTIFYANRSKQINSAAEEWNNWKRWVLDSKKDEFEDYKDEVIKSIEIQNTKILKDSKVDELIKKAESNNQLIFIALQDPIAKNYIYDLKKRKNQTKVITIIFLLLILPISLNRFNKYCSSKTDCWGSQIPILYPILNGFK